MDFLKGKKALVTGVISDRSIAFGIAKILRDWGADLAFTYQDPRFADRVKELAAKFDSNIVLHCDVSDDNQIQSVFAELGKHWDGLDIIIHSIAYAPADQLDGDYVTCVNREGFRIAHDVSSYSFAALAKAGLPMMEGRNGALLTLSYLGAERAIVNYNVMGLAKASLEANVRYMAMSLGAKGIRVNGISAGPIRTLAASGIKDFRKLLANNEKITPLHRNVTLDDVGNTAAFLCSDLAAGITGEIVHVDSGFHVVGLAPTE
jgi:enoyl-[acyl-carrier protein] reductase I